jgi:hypothetical protein
VCERESEGEFQFLWAVIATSNTSSTVLQHFFFGAGQVRFRDLSTFSLHRQPL